MLHVVLDNSIRSHSLILKNRCNITGRKALSCSGLSSGSQSHPPSEGQEVGQNKQTNKYMILNSDSKYNEGKE